MFFVNRIELIKQSIDKFSSVQLSVIKAGNEYKHLYYPECPCQLTMLQTWYARRSDISFNPDIIIVDELHDGWGTGRMKELLALYPEAKLIGMTATPIDAKGILLKGFDAHVQSVQIKDLQQMINPQNGLPFLAKDINYVPEKHDFSGIKLKGNDYDPEELAQELSQKYLIDNIVDLHKKDFKKLKTLAFCVNISHAELLNKEFQKAGYTSAVIHSNMKNSSRKNVLEWHKEGKIDILLNVGILTTGYDDPSLQCIVLAYPTKSLRKYIQMVGRGGRVQSGKKEFVFLDFGNNIQTHGLWSEERHFLKNKCVRVKEFEPIICPGCFKVIEEKSSSCPYCGYNLVEQYEKREAVEREYIKAEELKRVKEMRYKNETSIDLLRELFALKNDERNPAVYFKNVLLREKPENMSEDYFNKTIQPIIKKAVRNSYKIGFVYYKIKESIDL